jgi:hypothetical protein
MALSAFTTILSAFQFDFGVSEDKLMPKGSDGCDRNDLFDLWCF